MALSNRLRKRGIFIISVLLITVLTAMFVGASINLAPWSLKRAGSQGDLAAAQRAARSGIEYALAKLRAEPQWRANPASGTPTTVVDQPGLVVVEERGNVVGLITSGGTVSQFRLRFNYQDGAGGEDSLDDPGTINIAHPLVSFNNVLGMAQANVPRADGPGFSVPASPTPHTQVPAHGVYLACEGRVGNFLQGASAANPNPALPAFGSVTQAWVEAVYKVNDIGQMVTPAVASSAGNFTAEFPDNGTNRFLELDSADNSTVGRLRSREAIEIKEGEAENLRAPDGKQGEFRQQSGYINTGGAAASNVQGAAETAIDGLYNIGWADVRQASGTDTIRAGVYVVNDANQLRFYDMSLAEYKVYIAANPTDNGQAATLPTNTMTAGLVDGDFKITITGDTLVSPGNGTSDLAIIPKKGVDAGEGAGGVGETSEWLTGLTTPRAGVVMPEWGNGKINYSPDIEAFLREVAAYHGVTSGDWIIPGSPSLAIDDVDQADMEFEGPNGNGPLTTAIITRFGPLLNDYLSSPAASASNNLEASLLALGLSGGAGPIGEIPAVADSTTTRDILVEFDPDSTSAVLSGAGNVTIGARVQGEGGSITSEGDINLVGLGVTLEANPNPNEGVSLYSKGNVFISTFDKALNKYWDVGLKGVVYCWGDFKALLGSDDVTDGNNWGTLQVNGALVAYGKDPDSGTAATRGKIDIRARRANLKYDASYLLSVMGTLPGGLSFGRVWWLQR